MDWKLNHPVKVAVDNAMRSILLIVYFINNSALSLLPQPCNSLQYFCEHHFIAVCITVY